MNDVETWQKLDRNIDIPWTDGCYKMSEDEENLTLIYFSAKGRQIKIVFDDTVYAFRETIESAVWKTLHYLRDNYEPLFYENEWLYEVKNSQYLKWLEEESGGLYTRDMVRHFAFYTQQEIIEVLSSSPPKIMIEDAPTKTESK